jgi:hypothetical protein
MMDRCSALDRPFQADLDVLIVQCDLDVPIVQQTLMLISAADP